MRITSAGNVSCSGSIGCVGVSASGGISCGGTLNLAGYEIKYNLFNNSGLPHATTTDFNAISQYGFRYIFSPA